MPLVTNAMLDTVPADGDEEFLDDVVWLLKGRFAQAEEKGVDQGGYDADDREQSAQRHFGSALASALAWCVLKIRALIPGRMPRAFCAAGARPGRACRRQLEAAEAAQHSYLRYGP